jgi:hypothetical protein
MPSGLKLRTPYLCQDVSVNSARSNDNIPERVMNNERQNGWLVFVFCEVGTELIGQHYSTLFLSKLYACY